MRRTSLLVIGAIMMAFVISACGSDDSDSSEGGSSDAAAADGKCPEEDGQILIGHVLGETGWMRYYDVPAHNTAQMAVEDVNAEGGVLGCKLAIEKFDMKTDPPQGVNGVLEMLDRGADVLIGPGDFDTAAPALTTAEENKKVIFAAEGADYKLGLFGPYTYSMGLASNVQGAAAAEWAYEKKGWRSAYVLTDTSIEITKTAGQFFIQRFSELEGAEVVGSDTFLNDDPSIASQITALENTSPQPDFIYVASYVPGSASAIKQIRDAGVDIPIVCQIACGEGTEWLDSVPRLTDFYYTNMGYVLGPGDPNPEMWEVAQRYEEEYGKVMQLSQDLAGYASVQMLAHGVEASGSLDGDKIRDALDTAEGVETILGPVSFTPEFHMMYETPVRIQRVVDGEQQFVETWTPEDVNLTGDDLPGL